MKKDLNNDGKVTMTEEILAALGTYARAFLSAAIALYMTALIYAVIPQRPSPAQQKHHKA